MTESSVTNLGDLARLRGAPELHPETRVLLRQELHQAMAKASWFTVGVMAPSIDQALSALRSLEQSEQWDPLELVDSPEQPARFPESQSEGARSPGSSMASVMIMDTATTTPQHHLGTAATGLLLLSDHA